MNCELDFLYDDLLRDVRTPSPLLSSESTTDLFSGSKSTEEEPPQHLPADFNPDDFINDTQDDNSLFIENGGGVGSRVIVFSDMNQWDSPQTSPQSSRESEPLILPSSVSMLPSIEIRGKPAIVAVPQGNTPSFNAAIINGPGCSANPQSPAPAEECFSLVNFYQTSDALGPMKVSLSKCVNKPDSSKVTNRIFVDERVLRKQQRMIRNRESAFLSRKKKKEYVSSLESKISVLEKENLELRWEVASLKNQLNTIAQTCNCNSRHFLTSNKNIGSQVKKNTAVLLAMIFMVSLNFGKFHSFFVPDVPFQRHKLVDSSSNTSRLSVRKLLWINESLPAEDDVFGPQENCNETLSQFSHNFINQTENMRLTKELRKLAGVRKKSVNLNDNYDPVQFYDLKSREYLNSVLRDQGIAPEKKKYSKLIQEIHRKDDTFYILSFNSENILLPAALYNESSRPKMSLMLPTRNFLGNRKIAFMQIDCEVLNTSTIQIKDTFVPANFRNNLKSGSAVENKSNATNNKDKHKFNLDAFPWKENTKKNIYKPQFYGRNVHKTNKNAGVPDINSIYSIF